jgi:hypothetical protein
MRNMDYFHRDTHLDAVIDTLLGREQRQGEATPVGWKITWTKQELMDFAGWRESTYTSLSKEQKTNRLQSLGVTLHDLTGKGVTTQAKVTIHNYAWYSILLRGKSSRSDVVEAYLDNLFMGKGYMEVGGVQLAATIKEFAQKYANQFGETVSAAKNKLDRVREPLNEYKYLVKGTKSYIKQIRVKVNGSETWLQGQRAIYFDYQIRRNYADFYQKLNEKIPYRKSDTVRMRLQAQFLRRDETNDFTELLKRRYKLDRIYSHHLSTLSDQARTDYDAIIALYMSGATFTEIRGFLETRPAYWLEVAKAEKVRRNNPQPIDYDSII